jgi:hypothetical protein
MKWRSRTEQVSVLLPRFVSMEKCVEKHPNQIAGEDRNVAAHRLIN